MTTQHHGKGTQAHRETRDEPVSASPRRRAAASFFSFLLVSLSLLAGCDNNTQWPATTKWPTMAQWPSPKNQVPLTEPTEVASPAEQRAANASDQTATSQRAPNVTDGANQPAQTQPAAPTQTAPAPVPSPAPAAPTQASKSAREPSDPLVTAADTRAPITPHGITVIKAGATATPPNAKPGHSGPMALTDLNNPPPRQTVVISPDAVTVTTAAAALPPMGAPAGTDSMPNSAPAPTSHPSIADDQHARIITAPMVQVNGRYISVDDVYRGAYERAEAVSTLLPKRDYMAAIKKVAQDELNIRIHDCLVITEAEKKLADEEKTQIDKEMEDTLADMITDAGTKAKLQDRYAQRGFTLEDVLKDQRQRLTIHAYLRSHFSSELVVGRKTLYEYFTNHKGEFSTPLKVQMQIISSPAEAFLLKDNLDGRDPSPSELKVAKEDARRNIELAAKALGEGKTFDQAAKTFSKDAHAKDGGLWPTMPKGSLKEAKLEEAAFTQKEGQVSDIIPTDTGYYLVKTRKIERAAEQTFEAVQDKIEARLKDENYRKVTDQYMTKVYEGATISRTDELLEAVCLRLANTFTKP